MAKISGPIEKCEKCGGAVWDNRDNKPSPKSPDFKCKDKSCGEAFWLDKPKASGGTARAPAGPKWTYPLLQETYRNCLRISAALVPTLVKGATSTDVVSGAATLFIAASRDGVVRAQPLEEKPAAIVAAEKEDEDDLPW